MGRRTLTLVMVILLGSTLAAWWALAPDEHPLRASALLRRDVPGGGERYESILVEPGRLERLLAEPVDGRAEVMVRSALAGAFELPAPEPPSRDELAGLLADLRDDDVRGNASAACARLRVLLGHGETRAPVEEALLGVLGSMDFQQRYLAAHVLMGSGPDAPCDRLLAVVTDMLCEGRLQNGAWAMDEVRRIGLAPQSRAIRFLVDHAEAAEPRLLDVLGLDRDPEARFLASFVLAYGGRAEHVDRVAPTLIRQLSDNDIAGDALMAMNALMRLDPERVIGWLYRTDAADDQFLRSRRLLVLALRNGGMVSKQELVELNAVSRSRHPLEGWTLGGYGGWR